jgi:hypothetical protein
VTVVDQAALLAGLKTFDAELQAAVAADAGKRARKPDL